MESTQMNNNIPYTEPFTANTSDRDDDLVSTEDIKRAMEVENG